MFALQKKGNEPGTSHKV